MTGKHLAAGLLVLVASTGAYLWLLGGWFHIELLPVSEHVRMRGLLTVFDWSVFDVSPARLRPLSDLLEVTDALMRPWTVPLFGLHPSFSLSAILIAVLCGWFFNGAMRAIGLSGAEALVATSLLVSTIGYLSCFVPYIRPAKRLAVLALCVLLFLVFRYLQTKSDWLLAWLVGVLFLSFFADEAAFVYWPVVLLFIGPRLGRARRAACLAVPVVFLLVAQQLMPPIYGLLGTSGPRDRVIGSGVVADVLARLLRPEFYGMALEDLGRSTAASFGTIAAPIVIPIALILVTGAYGIAERNNTLIAASLSVIGASLFLSMLDPGKSQEYMGQWTYYYHSPVAVLSITWAAVCYHSLPLALRSRAALGIATTAICALNFANFSRTNEIIKIIHTYPMARLEPREFDSEGLAARLETLLQGGALPHADAFRRQFAYYRAHPMGDAAYADSLERTFGRN